MPKFSRRQIVGGAVTGSLMARIAGAAQAAPAAHGSERADVCVVGAGFAGLAAAYRLKGAGASVVVLEARDRVGGKALTIPLNDGAWVEMGAQWIGPGQDRILALIKDLECDIYRSPKFGKTLQLSVVKRNVYHRIARANDDYPGSAAVNAGYEKLDKLAKTIDPEQPWSYPNAEQLDATTFAQWLRQNIANETARRFVGTEVTSIVCANPEEISVLHLLFLIKACKGLDVIFGDEGGAQQDRVVGGAQLVAQRLAAKMDGAIRYHTPVRRIEWSEQGAVVHGDSTSIAARRVIIAIPPNLAGAIDYEPSLPAERVQITQRWPQGIEIKVQMIYREPFWRGDGLSGASYDYESPLGETADGGVPEHMSKAGILTGFVYAANARRVAALPAARRRKLLLDEAAKRFGPKALEPVGYYEANWAIQPWTRGCTAGFLAPGATVLFRSAVRDPVGPLHWASTETSTVWPSFMEGAVRSGERAAAEIAKS